MQMKLFTVLLMTAAQVNAARVVAYRDNEDDIVNPVIVAQDFLIVPACRLESILNLLIGAREKSYPAAEILEALKAAAS
jgi:hypothetical protein